LEKEAERREKKKQRPGDQLIAPGRTFTKPKTTKSTATRKEKKKQRFQRGGGKKVSPRPRREDVREGWTFPEEGDRKEG